MANSNRRRSFIDSLLIDGTISTNRSEISEHIVQFYKQVVYRAIQLEACGRHAKFERSLNAMFLASIPKIPGAVDPKDFCLISLVGSIYNFIIKAFFSSSRSLRQGDPLSPLSFVIVMKMLSKMISTAVSGGLLSCFFVGTMTDVSHLLFADDTLFFCGADPNPLHNRGSLFLCFDVVSEYCEKYAKAEDIGAAPEDKSSDEELSEDESDSSDEQVAGKADP
ncbi:hypothetical protein SLA2020_351090 [Shorea laevis]